VLESWRGNAAYAATAQQCFYLRAKCNGAARYGKYTSEMEVGVA
jgi:fructose-bisphosphate aldolase class I